MALWTGPVHTSAGFLVRGAAPPAPKPAPAAADDPPAAKGPTHTHIWIDQQAAPAKRRDQGQEDFPAGEAGELLCSLRQNGETGEWSGEHASGRPLRISPAEDGGLVIHHFPDRDNIDQGPDQIELRQPPATEGQNRLVDQRRSGDGFGGLVDRRDGIGALRDLQSAIDSHYRTR
jgi:hypothetical protein